MIDKDDMRESPDDAGTQEKSAPHAPKLAKEEEKRVEERASADAKVIHETIRREGESELRRSSAGLAWSAIAAGLSMGFSFVAEALLRSHLPEEPWRPLLAKFGYAIGFLIVVLGKQQLFTENTLTPIIPLLSRRDTRTLRGVLRLWVIVLIANIAGAGLFSLIVARSVLFPPELHEAFGAIGREALRGSFGEHLLQGVFAGWLIALMVWIRGSLKSGDIAIIIIITYIVGLAGLSHIVVGSVETLYLVAAGEASLLVYINSYFTPTLLGNIIGGVALVAALNHAQVVSGERGMPAAKRMGR